MLASLGHTIGGSDSSTDHNAAKNQKTYHLVVPGVLKMDFGAEKSKFTIGEPVLVKKRLTNIGSATFALDADSFSEGFSLQRMEPSLVCGTLGDVPSGFHAKVTQLLPGASITSGYDMSSHPCFQ